MRNTRIRLPSQAKVGGIVEVRAMILHPMDNGFTSDSTGAVIPVNIVTKFICQYEGREVFRAELAPGLSANPIFTFRLRANRTGPVHFTWIDQDGAVTTDVATLKVT
jgi:sulfur-oxidizing protein SoxZ